MNRSGLHPKVATEIEEQTARIQRATARNNEVWDVQEAFEALSEEVQERSYINFYVFETDLNIPIRSKREALPAIKKLIKLGYAKTHSHIYPSLIQLNYKKDADDSHVQLNLALSDSADASCRFEKVGEHEEISLVPEYKMICEDNIVL